MASLETNNGQTAAISVNGIADEFQTIPDRVTHHADAILRASGSSLRNYTMDGTRRAILSAVMDCYEEAYRAGAARAAQAVG